MMLEGSAHQIINTIANTTCGRPVAAVLFGNRNAINFEDAKTGIMPSTANVVRAVGFGVMLDWLIAKETVKPQDSRIILSGGATNGEFPEVTEARVMYQLIEETNPDLIHGENNLHITLSGPEVTTTEAAITSLEKILYDFSGVVLVATEHYHLPRVDRRVAKSKLEQRNDVLSIPLNPFFGMFLPNLVNYQEGYGFHGHTFKELAARRIRPPVLEYLLEAWIGKALSRYDYFHHLASKFSHFMRTKVSVI